MMMAVRSLSLSSCIYLLFLILNLITNTNLRIDVQLNNVVTTSVTSKSFRSRGFNTSRIIYYTNSVASFQLARIKQSGDVNPNPGPSSLENHETNSDDITIQAGKGLKIGHWNVNCLTDAKFEQIKLLLIKQTKVDVLFLTETFLKPTKPDSVLNISSYMLFRKDRIGQMKGGGILAYVSENIVAERIASLEEIGLETLWLQINPYKSKRKIIVGAVYRPPLTTADLDVKLELNIEAAYLRNQELHLLGDFNINYLDQIMYKKHRLVKGLGSLGLSQMVNTITRAISSTCLDHVYTTHPAYIVDVTVPNIGLSDHLPVFIRRKYCKIQKNSQHNTIVYRDFKKLNKTELLHDLENAPWDSDFESGNVNEALASIEIRLNEILDRHIPFKTKRVKKSSQPLWMTEEILQSIKTRDNLLKDARKSNKPEDWSHYKYAKYKTINEIRKAKRNFFRDNIEQNRGNPKAIWNALKNLSGTTKAQTKINVLETKNGIADNQQSIASELNRYFTNILESLTEENDFGFKDYDDEKLKQFISSRLNSDRSFSIPEITLLQTMDMIKTISLSKATGHDGISTRVLKLIAPVFANTLCKIINLSITTNTFPNNWKIGQVIPIYKNGARNKGNNYRPITVLPVFSKILEKHVATSLLSYLRENNLLYKLQSAFRTGHSTETALIRITDEILFNMDKDEVTGLVFIDFRKAFDVIDHELLVKKLSIYGVGANSITWFKSYLEERQQYVKLGTVTSEKLPIKQGVPQGSILGPILFLLFVNDLPLHTTSTTADIYADDTTISQSSCWSEVSTLSVRLSKDLADIVNWSNRNKMFINTDKTKALLVVGKRLRRSLVQSYDLDLQIHLDNTVIEQVTSHELLGLQLDQDLTYETHINALCKKLSKRLGLLRHISPYLRQSQREAFYLAVIKPLMMYGSSIWSSCNKDMLERVLKMQKRAARIILGAERTTRTITMFNKLNWIPFYTEAFINRCSMIYKRLYGLTPEYLNDILKTNSDVHTRNTRFSNINFLCPCYKKSTEGGRTFSVRTIKDWNQLPLDIKRSTSIKNFKKNLYSLKLNRQKETLNFE